MTPSGGVGPAPLSERPVASVPPGAASPALIEQLEQATARAVAAEAQVRHGQDEIESLRAQLHDVRKRLDAANLISVEYGERVGELSVRAELAEKEAVHLRAQLRALGEEPPSGPALLASDEFPPAV